jgi:hypothetical protein
MKGIYRFLIVACCLSNYVRLASAFPSGAGACLAGQASVSGLHLSQPTLITGTLDEGSYTISVDSKAVQNGASLSIMPQGLEFDIVVAGPNFKGILIRVDGTTADQVAPGSGLSVPTICSGSVGAATHSNAVLKQQAVATVSLDQPGVHAVDITLVVENSGGVSEYYYSSFTVEVSLQVTSLPSQAPSQAPSQVPSQASSQASSQAPSRAPTGTDSPTSDTPLKKPLPNDSSKDDTGKLFGDTDADRGGLQRRKLKGQSLRG